VCTIGDLVLDVVVLPERHLARDDDVPAVIRVTPGGQAANVAVWAGALGAGSRLICKRGDDAASDLASAHLARLGVDVRGPVARGHGGVVISIREDGGRRTMISDRGVASLLHASELEVAWLQGCDVLHVSGYCLFDERIAAAAIRAASLVPKVSVDLASADGIRAVGPQLLRSRLDALSPDLVFATEQERAAVGDYDATWVTKLGARGAIFPEGRFPARLADPVDTTGAGDALAAGYLVGGPELAMRAAAHCISRIGAMPASTAARAGPP
jgi:sugar/nucleoside kinase (ribokinase family)